MRSKDVEPGLDRKLSKAAFYFFSSFVRPPGISLIYGILKYADKKQKNLTCIILLVINNNR